MARIFHILTCSSLYGLMAVPYLLASGCVRNTVDPSGDGRLFLLLDMPPRVQGGTIGITLEIENFDPISIVICNDPETNAAPLCHTVDNPLDWKDVENRPLDMVGEVIPGGTEVRFFVQDNRFDRNQTQFALDGNTTIRLFINNPELDGLRHVEIERTVQQTLF